MTQPQPTLAPPEPSVPEPSLPQRARAGGLVGDALAVALRAESNLSGLDLSGANLDGADLTGLSLFKVCLRGASLREANLTGVELSGADLEQADLESATLVGTGLGMANLKGVNAFNADLTDATLTGADLGGATFNCARLIGARLREANLESADFRAADFRRAELSLCRVDGAYFDDADLRGARLRAVSGFKSAQWYGVDLREINFAGAYRLHRHIVDANYLREFRESGPLQMALYRVWWLTSDCGRSIGRWAAATFVVAAIFAALFAVAGLDLNAHPPGVITHFYFSVATLTTLGFGDIIPKSTWGQILVILEVCVGYMMLGGLISILAGQMARRGE
jgi:uncharacterized protein YjbI with pentapeptide repeats